MKKTKNNTNKIYPIQKVFDLIGNKWKVLIIRDLLEGTKRFGELKTSTGASQKSLATNLKEMENCELVTRKVYAQIPPKVEYSLTDLGFSLAPVLDTMAQWGIAYEEYTTLKNSIKNRTTD